MADINTGLQELEVVKQAFKSNISETGVSTSAVEFRDMPNLIKQLEKKYPTQKKTASPSRYSQTISADSGYRLSQVEVKPVTSAIDSNIIPDNIKKGVSILGVQGALEEEQIDLQAKFVEPKKTAQTILPDSNYDALSRVEVGAVTSAVDKNIQPAYIKKGVDILGVVGTLEGTMSGRLQEKTVTPTTSVQNIIADAGYDALSRVSVQAVVPSKYYKPEQSASVTPKTTSQTITPSDNYVFNRVDVSAVTSAIDPNIKAENIKKGVSILGVTGNMQEVGGSPKFAELVDGSITSVEANDLQDVESIASHTFMFKQNLVNVEIPSNVKSIGELAFMGTSVETLILAEGIETISNSAFSTTNIQELVLPSSLTSIGDGAFADIYPLEKVTIKSGITSLPNRLFDGCDNLTEVIMESTTPPSVGVNTFPSTAQIYVLYGAYDDYVASWTDYASQIVRLPAIPSTITVIVNDYTGALVSGASVTISGNGQTYTGTTDGVGTFVQGDLQPATYTISVADMEGFLTPTSSKVVVNEDTNNSVTITYLEKPNRVTYGVKIDLNNSDPETSVTYTDDAVGFEKSYMDFDNDTFVYGSWADKFPFNQIRPCLMQNGKVICYLNPNNYAQDVDGNSVDITTTKKNDVMIEFPKIYYRLHNDANYQYVQISDQMQEGFCCFAHTYKTVEYDHVYVGAYRSVASQIYHDNKSWSVSSAQPGEYGGAAYRSFSKNKGTNYEAFTWHMLVLLQCLYLIQFKNLNSQSALGVGITGSKYASYSGSLNTKGMYYGKNTSSSIKLMGIEDIYGNAYPIFVDGITIENNHIKILNPTFSSNSYGGTYSTSIESPNNGGYATKIQGSNLSGFLGSIFGGTAETYYCDNQRLYNNDYMTFGGTPHTKNTKDIGMFSVATSSGYMFGNFVYFK